jgi:hypothetical protein
MVQLAILGENSAAVDIHLDAAKGHAALDFVTGGFEGVDESALFGSGGDFESVAIAGDAVLDASGNELLVLDSSGLAVHGDRSRESKLSNGSAHCISVQIVGYLLFNAALFSSRFPVIHAMLQKSQRTGGGWPTATRNASRYRYGCTSGE